MAAPKKADAPRPPAPALPPEEGRRIDAARAAFKKARDFARVNADKLQAQIQEWEQARIEAEGTPFLEETKRELAGLAARLKEQIAREEAEGVKGGLIGHWKLDEVSGASAADSSPAGAHGTLKGGPTWTPGRIGGALAFDGHLDRKSVV